MDRSFSTLRGVGGLLVALVFGGLVALDLSIEMADAGETEAAPPAAVEGPSRSDP